MPCGAYTQSHPDSTQFSCGVDSSAQRVSYGSYTPSSFCDGDSTMKYIRLAFHYILPEDYIQLSGQDCNQSYNIANTAGNLTETHDGFGNSNYNGFYGAEQIVDRMNYIVSNTVQQKRQLPGFTYPADGNDPHIRFLLKGVYFHRNDDHYEEVIPGSNDYHSLYDIGGENIIDVYMTNAGGFSGKASTIGGNNKYYSINAFQRYFLDCGKWYVGYAAHTGVHEVGHLLDLHHSWYTIDEIADTKPGFLYDKIDGNNCYKARANCWGLDPSIPGCPLKPCDEEHKISNNVMDYNNAPLPAITPGQEDAIEENLNSPRGNSYIYSCDGCMPAQAFGYIQESVCGLLAVYFNGQASFNEDEYLIEICPVSTQGDPICGSGYYSSGWETGTLGKLNLRNRYNFLLNQWYKLTLTVNNSECPSTDSHTVYFEVTDCEAESENELFEIKSLTNPFSSTINIEYEVFHETSIEFKMYNTQSGMLESIHTTGLKSQGTYTYQYTGASALSSGTYYVLGYDDQGNLQSKITIK